VLLASFVLVMASGCSNALPGSGDDEGAVSTTSAPLASPTRSQVMPIVTPTPVTPGATVSSDSQVAPTPPAENPETYVVVDNDTLYAIALRFGVEIQAIIELNGLSDPNDIRVGQELKIPPRQ
jgi:LysM repeat protein